MKLHHDPLANTLDNEEGAVVASVVGTNPAVVAQIVKRYNMYRRLKRYLDDAMKRCKVKDAEIAALRNELTTMTTHYDNAAIDIKTLRDELSQFETLLAKADGDAEAWRNSYHAACSERDQAKINHGLTVHALERQRGLLSPAGFDMAVERRRQIEIKGWTPAHDDGYPCGELAAFAAVYAMPPAARDWPASETGYGDTFGAVLVACAWAPKFGDRRRELVKAGALILAEIERLDRVPK